MAINFLLKRSNTASKRPTAAQLDIGELSLNYDANTAGVFFEDSAGNVRKVGPVEVSASAPNSSPAGSSGNSLGELWYDTGTSNLKVWTGSSFAAATATAGAGGSDTQVQFNSTGSLSGSSNFTFDGTSASIAGLVITGTSTFRAAATQDGVKIVGRAGGTSDYDVTLTPAALSADQTLTLPDATGTVALTADKLSAFAATTSAELAGVISDETGTGALVFASSPSLTTPILGVASATSINKVAITAPATGSTLTIADGKTLTVSNTLTFTGTDASSVAFGTGGTVAYTTNKLSVFAATTSAEFAGVISDETGTGALVFASSPTLTTPSLGVATATSINKVAITAPATSSTLTIADSKTLTVSNTLTFTGTDSSSVAFGAGGTVAYTADKLSVFAATTSAELAGVISDETGTGSLVFGTSPNITTSLTTGSASFDLLQANATTINFGGAATTIDIGATGVDILFPQTSSIETSSFSTNGGYQLAAATRDTGKAYASLTLDHEQDDTFGNALSALEVVDSGSLARGEMFAVTNGGQCRISAILRMGGSVGRSTDPTTGIHIFNTTSTPSGTLTNGASLYTVGGDLTAMDSAGNAVRLTPGAAGIVALTADKLSAFAATTSAELAGVISDETGSGALVFGTSPAITTSITTPSTTFDLVDTTATTVNFAGAATTVDIGAATGSTSFNHPIVVTGSTSTSMPGRFYGVNITAGNTSSAAGGYNYGNIALTNSDTSTGDGNLNCAISFSKAGSGRRRAMIACYQDGADDDPCGLKFYTYALLTTGSDAVSERYRITSGGDHDFISAGTTAIAANAVIDSANNNRLLRSTSSIRYKTDVEDVWEEKADAVFQMRPVWYRSKIERDNAGWSWYGLIAEEVAEIDPRLVHWGYTDSDYEWEERFADDGTPVEPSKGPLKTGATLKPDGVQYERLSVLLIKAIQKMNTRLEQLEQELAALSHQN